jgi:hypothetical protein
VVASLKGVAQKASDASKGAVARVKQMSPKSLSTEEAAAVKETYPHDVKNVVTSTSEHSKMSKVTTATKKVFYFCVVKCSLPARLLIFSLFLDSFQASECHEKDNHVYWKRHASKEEDSEN